MANILLIDDLRSFKSSVLEELNRNEPNTLVRICRSSGAAVEELAKSDIEWDQIWFDHDLGMVDGEDDTTMNVVDYLIFRDRIGEPLPVKSFVIHSANPVGVVNIDRALRSIGASPVTVNPSDFFEVAS